MTQCAAEPFPMCGIPSLIKIMENFLFCINKQSLSTIQADIFYKLSGSLNRAQKLSNQRTYNTSGAKIRLSTGQPID